MDRHWNLLDEFDLLSNIPNEFHGLIESKKWSDRRDALQLIIDLCSKNPRLNCQGNYRELIKKFLEVSYYNFFSASDA